MGSLTNPTPVRNEHEPSLWKFTQEKIMSFFSEATHRFLPIPEAARIETKSFLDAASEVVPFFGE